MAAVLNSNVASLWASKNLQGAQSKMADSVERLSSGLRINRAKDDAAGLGIANALTQQINGANQGVRNLNDGISMVQTAEGAIAAAQEMAQRILTLATQGANGTLGSTDRSAIQNEMKQLLTAIDSVGARTKFSGNSLLNNDARTGTGSNAAAGAAPTTEKFSLQVSNTTTDKISLSAAAFLNIGGTKGVADATAAAITEDAAFTMVMDTNDTDVVSGTNQPDSVIGTTAYKKSVSGDTTTYTKIGVVASSAISAGVQTLTFVSGQHSGWTADDTIVFSGQLTQNFSATAGDLSLSEAVQADLTTTATATAAFQMVQRAATGYITALSTQRSLLGAYQNQIEFTVSNVSELSSNLSSARSNVQDTDYASETATLTKGQILQQAATAMLAQANQMPNVILSLLK
jgi:flagellin